jgi:uncharacterized protein YdhG (YjbR/CyaY superfamily)
MRTGHGTHILEASMTHPSDVDAYIDSAPAAAQPLMRRLRSLIRSELPAATERISYGMPTYDYRGRRLVHFSAAKQHVGVYALVHADSAVPEELARYLDHRSTLRFRFDDALPTAALASALREKFRGLESST